MSSFRESTQTAEYIRNTVRTTVTDMSADRSGRPKPRPSPGEGGAAPVILAGVSGGMDSAVLLWALGDVASDLGVRVIACHVDHGLRSREEARKDLRAVTALAERCRVELRSDSVPPGLIERELGDLGGLEAAARHFRYMFYERMVRETGAELLCLGHHRNDQFETTLLRMVTGSDPVALAGMPRERSLAPELKCRILRPLLDVSKEEIRRAAGELSLPVSEDPTNSGDTVLRNRLRNRVIPHMQEAMPDLEARLGATRRRAALLRDLVEGTVEGFPWRRTRTERGECLSAAQTEIFALQPYLRLHVLIDAVNSVSGRRGRRVSDAFLSPFLREDLSSDARLKAAGHDVLVEAADGVLTVAPLSEPSRPEGFLLCGKRSSEDAPRGTAGAAVDEPSDEVFEEAVLGLTVAGHIGRRRIDCSMVSDGFAEPIVLRNRRPGDVLQRDGGTRRVKRVLIDLGVPKEFRDRIPVIEDRRGIVAVLGSVAGCTDALRTGVRHGHASSGHVIFQLKKD